MEIDIAVDTPISDSIRVAQVSSMFDVPPSERAHIEWHGNLPIEDRDWNIGLIVGPSGSGKSTILNRCFGAPRQFEWHAASVIDDFPSEYSIEDITGICQAVGFNTIPAWLRPYGVLSNGERFRVDLGRRLLQSDDNIVCDEFTSVVDRQVAQIGAHAVQKYIRRQGKKFVAATCHYDLEDWLQPDWVLEPATMTFRWRSVQRRPDIPCTVNRVAHQVWHTFARFHYLNSSLHQAAKCFVLCANGRPASFLAVLHQPHQKADDLYRGSRMVTLPDFQGLGLAFALTDTVASAFRACGYRYRTPSSHPAITRAFDKSPRWRLEQKPGMTKKNLEPSMAEAVPRGAFGGRPSAIFSYCGPIMEDRDVAKALIK